MNARVVSASVVGREHIRLWMNNQDGIAKGKVEINGKEHLYAVVTDGCSEGLHSEVGAKLLARFIVGEIPVILFCGTTLEELPKALFMRCIGYLRGIAAQTVIGDQQEMVSFIKNYLLCTVVGFVMDDESCVVFHAGDGVIVVNDTVCRINQDNKPRYLAYHLVDRRYLVQQSASQPEGFEAFYFSLKTLDRLVIATDGLDEKALPSLNGFGKDIQLLRELKGLSRNAGCFSDDCSLVIAERVANPEGKEA